MQQSATLPMMVDPEEIAAAHARIVLANERKERARVAAGNRARGIAEPKPGDKLFVEPRGERRARGGILFVRGAKTTVLVVGEDDTVGVGQVRAHGAEEILADPELIVGARNATEDQAAKLRADNAAKDAEIAKLKADNERYIREARMRAPDDENGGPARLRAAAKARGERSDPESFGSDK